MTGDIPDAATARRRYFLMAGARLIGAVGAMFGIVLMGRAETLAPRLIGFALTLAALLVMATLPRALARRWRTPDAP